MIEVVKLDWRPVSNGFSGCAGGKEYRFVKKHVVSGFLYGWIHYADLKSAQAQAQADFEALVREYAVHATSASGCGYPKCGCAIGFPEGYKPSWATECPRNTEGA